MLDQEIQNEAMKQMNVKWTVLLQGRWNAMPVVHRVIHHPIAQISQVGYGGMLSLS